LFLLPASIRPGVSSIRSSRFFPHAELNRPGDGGNIARREFLFGDQFREWGMLARGDIPFHELPANWLILR
jgi:hypothetical protein